MIITAVAPVRSTVSAMSASIRPADSGSSPVVGSSKNSTSGSAASARASPARFCCPPERSAGRRSASARSSPTASSISSARSRLSARLKPSAWSRRKPMFSQIDSESNSAPPWNSMPIRARASLARAAGSASTSTPSIRTEPAVAGSRPRMAFRVTDLPVPEPPSSAMVSPGRAENCTRRRMSRPPRTTRRSDISSAADIRRPRTTAR
ncbi:MAG: Uncharacterised protein [Rhodospirillaceae bacterium]|nr:MAG: Uncharacterised protein [Rhodospirillaceae bacterium]